MSWIGTTLVSWLAAFSTLTVHFQSYCGPVLKPEPRREPWNIKYAKELAREVREADASGVSLLSVIDTPYIGTCTLLLSSLWRNKTELAKPITLC